MMRISYADVLEEGVMNSVGLQVSDGADPAEKTSAKRRKIDLSDKPLQKQHRFVQLLHGSAELSEFSKKTQFLDDRQL